MLWAAIIGVDGRYSLKKTAQQHPPIHLTAYQLCVFARHRKVEIAYTAISLLYGSLFLKYPLLSQLRHRHNDRLSGVSDHRFPRGEIRTQGLQDAKHLADDCSRRDRVFPGYLYVSLRARDDASIGEGNSLRFPCQSNAEISPAKSSTLTGYVSARSEVYRRIFAHHFA